MKTFAFVFLFVLFEIAMCLRCQHCQPSSCPPRPKCKGGYVKGLCNCCYTCAKLDGEKCGGIWNMHGKCDAGLICARDKPRSKGVCVSSNTSFLSTQSKCTLPQETGPCKAMIRSWYYDSVTKTCKKFIYGGCKGNQNRFKGKAICLLTCAE